MTRPGGVTSVITGGQLSTSALPAIQPFYNGNAGLKRLLILGPLSHVGIIKHSRAGRVAGGSSWMLSVNGGCWGGVTVPRGCAFTPGYPAG